MRRWIQIGIQRNVTIVWDFEAFVEVKSANLSDCLTDVKMELEQNYWGNVNDSYTCSSVGRCKVTDPISMLSNFWFFKSPFNLFSRYVLLNCSVLISRGS